jgi:hypothetical protein
MFLFRLVGLLHRFQAIANPDFLARPSELWEIRSEIRLYQPILLPETTEEEIPSIYLPAKWEYEVQKGWHYLMVGERVHEHGPRCI